MPALQEQLLTAITEGLLNLPLIGFYIGNVAFGMSRYAVKIAEFAIGRAYIGCIHITVYDPGHLIIRYLDLPQFISHISQFCQRGLLKQKDTFFCRKELEV
jgi:hypothetical protein